jgi:hypothetical protein
MPIITPDQQREFEAARRALEALCHLRRDPWHYYPSELADPELAERVRWLLIRMGLARGTPGGEAVARLARHGYAICSRIPWRERVVTIDAPGVILRGEILPCHGGGNLRWTYIERTALAVDNATLSEHRWGSAHDLIHIRAKLRAEGVPMPSLGAS